MTARIAPATPPFPSQIQARLEQLMPAGIAPLTLFTTLARDARLFERFMSGGLLDRGNLTLKQRELIIDRVTACNGAEYEWGVHVALFAARVGFTPTQLRSLVYGSALDACWDADERVLLRLCDSLHEESDVNDALWADLAALFPPAAIIESIMLAGFYRTVSYLVRALRLPQEAFAARFPDRDPG
jgi:alkylhydroperoxidase family enzyme